MRPNSACVRSPSWAKSVPVQRSTEILKAGPRDAHDVTLFDTLNSRRIHDGEFLRMGNSRRAYRALRSDWSTVRGTALSGPFHSGWVRLGPARTDSFRGIPLRKTQELWSMTRRSFAAEHQATTADGERPRPRRSLTKRDEIHQAARSPAPRIDSHSAEQVVLRAVNCSRSPMMAPMPPMVSGNREFRHFAGITARAVSRLPERSGCTVASRSGQYLQVEIFLEFDRNRLRCTASICIFQDTIGIPAVSVTHCRDGIGFRHLGQAFQVQGERRPPPG
jgi:hypothetical protein